ncbi:MAG: metal ABC transporter substrate-binding protein [Ilumatobacteraceae bacterium]
MRDGAQIIELGSETITEDEYIYDFSFPESGGKPNPHLWTDPMLALRYGELVKDDVAARDPANADYYQANYDAFEAMVDEFDEAMRTAFATIPEGQRRLLTYHDAYAYFAETYDWEVIGAIQVSDFGHPTPGDVADLIDQVRSLEVPAIFGSEVFPSPVLEQIGRETGVRYVDVLRDDDLPGEPGENEHSWVGLMRFDFATMTEALGGDPAALEAFAVRNVAPTKRATPSEAQWCRAHRAPVGGDLQLRRPTRARRRRLHRARRLVRRDRRPIRFREDHATARAPADLAAAAWIRERPP